MWIARGRAPSGAASSARKTAVSSAMLFVPFPMYSEISTRFSLPSTTTPIPAGPGFPEQAPSAYTWIACEPSPACASPAGSSWASAFAFTTRFARAGAALFAEAGSFAASP